MLTAMFLGEITIKEGRVEQSDFHDYRMMRLRENAQGRGGARALGRVLGRVGDRARRRSPGRLQPIFAATGPARALAPLKNTG